MPIYLHPAVTDHSECTANNSPALSCFNRDQNVPLRLLTGRLSIGHFIGGRSIVIMITYESA